MGLRNILAPRQQVQNSQGAPVAAGFVRLYEPGTTTFIQAFQDSGLTIPHTQPIRLSGSGRANIWISVNCDLRISDRNNQLVLTEDSANPDGLGASESGNLIANGSFELDTNADGDPDSWTAIDFTGSNNARDTTESTEGGASYRFTGTDANGGGELQTTNFFPVNDSDQLRVNFDIRSTVANVQNIVTVEWYDVSQVAISDTEVYNSTANPLTYTSQQLSATPPTNARFAKIELTGVAAAGPVTIGSTYFDRIQAFYPATVSGIFDNIEINNNQIITTNTNGDIHINPNGTGAVNLGNNGAVDLTDAKNSANIGTVSPGANPHLALAPGQIQAKATGTTSTDLAINPLGGDIDIGLSGSTTTIGGGLEVDEVANLGGNAVINNNEPSLAIVDGDSAANNRRWDLVAVADQLRLRVVNDANNAFANIMTVDRTLNVIDSIVFGSAVTSGAGLYLPEVAAGADVSNQGQVYVNTSNQLVYRSEAGTETLLGSGSPGGSTLQFQFNNAGTAFGGAAELAYNNITGQIGIVNNSQTNSPLLSLEGNGLTTGYAIDIEVGDTGNLTVGGAIRVLGPATGTGTASGLISSVSNAGHAAIAAFANGTGAGGFAITAYSNVASRTEPLVFIENDSGTSGVPAMRIQQDDVSQPSIDLTAAPGIKFSGTTRSADANTLDEYEEGTYAADMRPTVSGSFTISSVANELSYIKIGRLVHVQGTISITSFTSPVGNVLIDLPFESAGLQDNGESVRVPCYTLGWSAGTPVADGFDTRLQFFANSTTGEIRREGASSPTTIAPSVTAACSITFNFHYIAED